MSAELERFGRRVRGVQVVARASRAAPPVLPVVRAVRRTG